MLFQEKKDGGEAKEKPLVDVTEAAPEALKIEEVTKTEVIPSTEQAVPVEKKPVEVKAEAVEANEPPKEEKKEMNELPKEAAGTVATA